MEQKPTVGRIVHYFPPSGEFVQEGPFAAIVTYVADQWISLSVMPRGLGIVMREAVRQRAPGFTHGVWDWPERDAP